MSIYSNDEAQHLLRNVARGSVSMVTSLSVLGIVAQGSEM